VLELLLCECDSIANSPGLGLTKYSFGWQFYMMSKAKEAVVDRLVSIVRPRQFRGKFRLLDPFVPHEGERAATVFGFKIVLDLSRNIQRAIYIGNYERRETKLVRSILKSGMTVLDVGANVGYYTALAARIVGPRGRVFAVEPYPPNFQRLSTWITNNHVAQVNAFDFALGGTPGASQMFSAFADTDNPVMVAHGQPSVASVRVQTLDSWMNDWRVDRVDFLKLDVDGSETAVLAGASDTLADGRISMVLCEFCDEWLVQVGSSIEALWGTFLSAGFKPVWPAAKIPSVRLFNQLFVHG
jgi:FkbM family methyltransferase